MDKKLWENILRWFSKRTPKERLVLLVVGFGVIYLSWYSLLASPLITLRAQLKQQILSEETQQKIYEKEVASIERRIAKLPPTSLLPKSQAIVQKTDPADENSQLMSTIASPYPNIQFTSLKSAAQSSGKTSTDALEVQFHSGYFDAIAYLTHLEKLPWCLSWDSLNYKVMAYPDAAIVINLHVENT